MTFEEFASAPTEPRHLSPALRALWHDGRGDWDEAHRLIMDAADTASAWVHAYLHRKEGDLPNARYWYRLANRPEATGPLDAEWAAMVRTLLPLVPLFLLFLLPPLFPCSATRVA